MIPTPSSRPIAPAPAASPGRWTAVGLVLLTLVLSWLAIRRIDSPRYPLDVRAALSGMRQTLPATGRAVLVVWLPLVIGLSCMARWLRRRADDLSIAEAVA